MKNLSSLLERVVGALHADSLRKAAILEAITECTGGTVSADDVFLKDGILTINTSPAQKSELRLKEEKILACIYEKCGVRVVRVVYA